MREGGRCGVGGGGEEEINLKFKKSCAFHFPF